MKEQLTTEKLHGPVEQYMRTDFVELNGDLTVAQALDTIRELQPAGRIIYFYVTDIDRRLEGVVPTRRLLLSPREKPLREIMIKPVITIPRSATLLEACEFFILHKLLAFPIVDEERRIIGLVDVELYTEELTDRDLREGYNELFQLIGVHATDARQRSVGILFRRRFPWLLATVAGGLLAAVISTAYFDVASQVAVVPFIPLVLALASSITSQSVSLSIQSLRTHTPTWSMFFQRIRAELGTGLVLGAVCGLIVALAVLVWKGDPNTTLGLVASIVASSGCAAVLGLAIPYLLHRLSRSPLVAAGPVALASVDAVTLLVYFNVARWWLG